MIGKAIVKQVILESGIGSKDFFGTSRTRHLVRARRKAIKRLKAAGFSDAATARIMKRNVSTVQYWLHPEYRERSRAYSLNYWRALKVRSTYPAYPASQPTQLGMT